MKKCILFDTNNIFCKYYYSNKEKCIDFCLSFIKNLIRLFKVNYSCCVFDGLDNYRKHLYAPYKSTRKEKPEDFNFYFEEFIKTLNTNNIHYIFSKTLEAEDSINLIVSSNLDVEFIIISEDKDILQLKKYSNCNIYKRYNEFLEIPKYCNLSFNDPWFFEKYKLFFSLYGDSCDNIPGVVGLGPKKTNFIVDKVITYENLKTILRNENFDELKKDTDKYSIHRCLELIKTYENDLDISYKLFSLFENFEYRYNLSNLLIN